MIRTRFAPSPTGYLHIGGVRTALFNWLFAKHHGGQFLLRIDDTDQQRNLQETLQPILDGFRWLGLLWDEGPEVGGPYQPYFQSARKEQYQSAVDELLSGGFAYRDYATAEEIQEERLKAQEQKARFVYSRRWMAETDSQAKEYEVEGRQAVVRLKMPREGVCVFKDEIRGEIEFEWALEQDHVIQRADGSCLYHLASAVDDHDFKITHVIRAVEHLPNTPRQIFIARCLGYKVPVYAHLPYVAEPGSGEKLSKRKINSYLKHQDFAKLFNHGEKIAKALGKEARTETFSPVTVDFYRSVGYQPEALLNYLLLLGWSLDDKTEMFSAEEMIAHFTLSRVNKSPASFDPIKLLAFEERHMQKLSTSKKVKQVLPFLENIMEQEKHIFLPLDENRLRQVVEAAGDRLKVTGDIVNYVEFFQHDDALMFEAKAFKKRLQAPGATKRLQLFREELRMVGSFDAVTLDEMLHRFIGKHEMKIGEIIHALRVAITGKAVGFGIFESLAILGRSSCIKRIDQAIARTTAE